MFNSALFSEIMAVERIIKRKISLRDAAQQIGISPATLNRLELGKQIPDIETFYKCCQWTELDMNKFFFIPKPFEL